MRQCFGIVLNTESAMVYDITAQEIMHGTSKTWKGHNFLNTCPNRASKKSIIIYTKSKCQ